MDTAGRTGRGRKPAACSGRLTTMSARRACSPRPREWHPSSLGASSRRRAGAEDMSPLSARLAPYEQYGPLPVLLVLLTVVTGVVDAVSYIALGHVFVANM